MKHNLLCSLLTLFMSLTFIGAIDAQVTLPHYEAFDYTVDANLGDQTNWANQYSGDEIVLSSGSLSYTGLPTSIGNSASFAGSGKDPYLQFSALSTGTAFASFIFKVTDQSAITDLEDGGYFVGLGSSTSSYDARLWVKPNPDASSTTFDIGFGAVSFKPDVTTSTYNVGDEIFVVISYNLNEGTVACWVNPAEGDLGGSAPTATITATDESPATSINCFVLRQDSNGETPAILVDELRIGTTWNDVTTEISNVDETSPIATFTPADGATDVAINSTITISFDEAVRNIDDSEITDPSTLLTLKETDITGADVAYSATINAEKTLITITPSADLANEKVYYVALAAVEDASDNATVAATSTFTTVALSTDATLVSAEYTIDNTNETITDILYGTDLATFKGNVSTSDNAASYEVYEADGTTVATDLQTGYKVIVTAEDASTKTYIVTIDAISTDVTLTSDVYTVDATAETITGVPFGTTLAVFVGNLTAADGATIEVFQADGTTVATDLQTGYKVVVTAQDGVTTATYTVTVDDEVFELYFSEYIEGSSSNKALEIYNPTDDELDLSDYVIRINSNGKEWSSVFTFPESEKLASKGVYVIAHAEADKDILAVADTAVVNPYDGGESYVAVFNGDDVRGLFKVVGEDTSLIDIIGAYDLTDPGQGWDVAGVEDATTNHTLLRKSSVVVGNTDWDASAGTSAEDSEWYVYDNNYIDNLGSPSPELNSEAEILEFTFPELATSVVFSDEKDSIACELIYSAQLDSLFPVFTLSDGATSTPASADSMDFTEGVDTIFVVAEDGITQKEWIVSVKKAEALSSEKNILTFSFDGQAYGEFDNDNALISVGVEYGTDLSAIQPTFTLSPGATSSPASGEALVFADDTAKIVVTAEDGTNTEWKIAANFVLTEVSTLADFRSHDGESGVFRITGEVILTAQMSYKNKKYVQDGTAGILIYDDEGVITTTYNEGDGITGLTGTIVNYYGILELIPVEDPGAASSTGNALTPEVVTVAELNANYGDYQSELIKLENVTFSEDEGETFSNGSNYDVAFGDETTTCRIEFYSTDLTGTEIPDSANIIGIGGQYSSSAQIYPRYLADVEGLFVSLSDDATLSDLEVDGVAVTGFDAATLDYSVELPYGTVTVPTVTATTTDENADVVVTPAEGLPGITSIVVTAEDETTTQTYTVSFTIETSAIENATISDVNVYPTMVQSKLYVSNAAILDNVKVIDLTGSVVMDVEVNSESVKIIDVSKLSKGIYILNAITGDKLNTFRFIKE